MNTRTGAQNITRTRTTEHAINIMILNTNTHAHTHSCRKHCKHGGCATTPAKGARDVLSSLISSTHVCAWLKISLHVALAARSPVQKLIATMKQGCSAQCGPGQGLWSWSPFLSLFFCDFGKKQTWKSVHDIETKTTASTHSSTGQRREPGCFLLFYDSWTLTQLPAKCNSNRFTSHLKVGVNANTTLCSRSHSPSQIVS